MPYQPGKHADEEALEDYVLGLVPQSELDAFEEHLLVCPECQDRLEEAEHYIRAMRSAAAELRGNPPRARDSGIASRVRRLARPGPVLVLAVVALAALVIGGCRSALPRGPVLECGPRLK